MSADMALFAARLAETRKLRRMSLDKVAMVAGCTKAHVWALEKGRTRNPSVNTVWALARALFVSPAWLLGLDCGPADDPTPAERLDHALREIELVRKGLA